jgi:Ni,Fe-hydrogenase I cytochrome b subunit
MTEFIVRVSAVSLLGLEVLLFALLFAARSVKALRIIEWSLCANSVLVLLFFGYFAWVFRDPWSIFGGTRPSEGTAALFRFAQGIWRLLLILTGIMILSAYVYRVRLVRLRGRGFSFSR